MSVKSDNTMEQLFETDSAPIQQGSGPHSAPGPSDGQAPAVATIAAPIPANQKRGYSKEELASGTLTNDDLEGILGLNGGHLQVARTSAGASTPSAASARVVDERGSESPEYPADIQFGQENRQGVQLTGRPCEGYMCECATTKPA